MCDFSFLNMNRTLLISLIALVLLIGIGAGAYFFLFALKPSVSVAPEGSVSLPTAGQGTTPKSTAPGTVSNTPTTIPVAPGTRLVEISAGPVVPGVAVVDTKAPNASSTPEVAVSFIERESGNVFSYLNTARTLTRINNKTIPGIQSAAWLPNGSMAFVRYLSGPDLATINTYALSATSSNGFFLPQNLADVQVASTSILTLTSGVNGSIGSTLRTDGTHATNLFTTPLTAARIAYAGKSQYVVFTKPAATLLGDAFLVDATGHFSRVAGPLNGLVALPSHSGKWVLVSFTENSQMRLQLVDTTTSAAITLPVSTIADKCVWTADDSSIYCGIPSSTVGNYPDDWYQGAAHFSDRIWKINVANRYAQFVLDFSGAKKGDLDAATLAVDPKDTVLVFLNKNDGSLWSYSL
jgi:hypothetical protein